MLGPRRDSLTIRGKLNRVSCSGRAGGLATGSIVQRHPMAIMPYGRRPWDGVLCPEMLILRGPERSRSSVSLGIPTRTFPATWLLLSTGSL